MPRDLKDDPQYLLRVMLRDPKLRREIVAAIDRLDDGAIVVSPDGRALRLGFPGPKWRFARR